MPTENTSQTLQELSTQWITSFERKGYSPVTIKGKKTQIRLFTIWCEERDLYRITDISKSILQSYQRYLSSAPLGRTGETLLPLSLLTRLRAVKLFFQWVTEQRYLIYNPALDWELPRESGQRIKDVLSVQEVESLLACCNLKTDVGIRDRAIMETLYSTGIRKKEITYLKPEHINHDEGILKVVEGKGDKQRLVPVGERALAWIRKYQKKVRETITYNQIHEPYLFLTLTGKPLNHLNEIIGNNKVKAGITKQGLSHLFRHSMTTLMLKNGADLRVIQAILGHSNIQTTTIYTHLDITHLKKVHQQTHPAEQNISKDQMF